nr:MAG TPA: hypothetical protein [Caudoviricetes sp.]
MLLSYFYQLVILCRVITLVFNIVFIIFYPFKILIFDMIIFLNLE